MNSMELINMKNTGNESKISPEVNNSFYEKYNPQIRAVVSRILRYAKQHDDIDDCVNAVFVDIMEKLQQYNDARGSLGAFVTVIARSAALNYCKSNLRRVSELVGDEKLDMLSCPIKYQDEAEFNLLVESIVAKLSKEEKVLFSMRYLYYYEPEEIAKALKIKRGAVDMRMTRLKNKIKSFLTREGGIII